MEAPVTLLDMTGATASYAGFWVHNGAATGAAGGVSAEARAVSPAVDLGRDATEPDLVDDDADGLVDGEDWGPPGPTGDYRLAVPLGRTFGILLGGAAWAPGQSVAGATADVDIALGAATRRRRRRPQGSRPLRATPPSPSAGRRPRTTLASPATTSTAGPRRPALCSTRRRTCASRTSPAPPSSTPG